MVQFSKTASAGAFTWPVRFDVARDGDSVDVTVRVCFRRATDNRADKWEKAIERIWNDKAVLTDGAVVLPIEIDCVQSGKAKADQVVHVVRGWHGATTMNQWFQMDMSGSLAAHEFGHMLGAPDEYPGGGTIEVRTGTLMSDLTKVVLPYYFDTIAEAVGPAFVPAEDLLLA